MHATVGEPTSSATDIAPPSSSASVLSASPPPAGSPNEHGPSPLRRLKSKSSLWSLGSSKHSAHEDEAQEPSSAEKNNGNIFLRRLSPALAARVKLLEPGSKVTSAPRNPAVGRIPESHIKELDSLHQDLSIKVRRRGQAWNGTTYTSPPTTQTPHRSASNTLELPNHDFLREISEALRSGSGSEYADAVIDGPELPILAASLPVPVLDAQSNSPPTSMSVVESASAPPRANAELTEEPVPNEKTEDTRTDFEKYVDDTKRHEEQAHDVPPAPPPKDSPPASMHSSSNSQSYFNSRGAQRADSIYSFSRASFSNQLSQLTSIPLPQAEVLETSISNIATAPAAVRVLNGHADQIQIWISRASNVLSGLDAEDDVEWAAAGGREGLEGVDKAIVQFATLVNVYMTSIENVQLREDIAKVDADSLRTMISQMETITTKWTGIENKLKGVKGLVELAMEWEELWSNVLGDVGMEIDNLSGMIFEMEEKRHQSLMDPVEPAGGLDINELETIVEESPIKGRSPASRLSIGPMLAAAAGTPVIKTPQDDTSYSNLMALFARMQPLRASLDFLPMRLSMFQSRAEHVFPSACEELDERRDRLEKSYKVLETDATALKKELGEDKWIIVFRNAGSQAQKMFDSVERSIAKLQEALESNSQVTNPSSLTKRMENYEAKKMHYVPAIERVITIIQKGVNDRLTVNGEILRLLSDMTSRTDALKASLRVMDTSLEDVQIIRGQQLRDSISSIVTMDSPATGSVIDTPGSSPASSVIMGGNGWKTPLGGSSRRESSAGSASARSTMSKVRRFSGIPQAAATLTGRKSSIPIPAGLASPTPSYASSSITPTPASRRLSRTPQPTSTIPNRPRWTNCTNLSEDSSNYTLRNSSAPARTPRPSSTLANPFRRESTASPAPGAGPGRSLSRISNRLASSSRSPARNFSSPTPTRSSLLDPPPYSRLRRPPGLSDAPRSRQSFAGMPSFGRSVSRNQESFDSPNKSARPGTALGHSTNKRASLLPLPRRSDKPAAQPVDTKPRWRA
ncbi:uncharacterized protein N7443_008826 [Penicillium atrosanguineum]|uniref:uncharacterized protein n=1 Tax=Penicillium atrosanguineum TaxID=1132637 RepID=UPI002395B4EB|nr:uncharacterized protein N7443_008826 [Penicillium atrosanguineum]KAJ5292873.1 hypothetical protein N7443_008826 [Penicillium atrosanguineum]